jgi:chromosome segregation protein
MHLRSITMRGFKSFPDRTRLEFTPGVSVIVGPNGSGKSNVTDAVLWALGEQSPLAVRGQTMQDVIFSGARGMPSRSAAEVEVVIDDSELELAGEFTELAITRRLDRSGDGEYRMNGARCRLVDVLEALSDTGLGKEMHSVVSQGRVESVIHSSPRDRRLLIEEAAGLGKHRKRRRRAELKLGRTDENLARALDVERESRSRLRPLKQQAEAADLHERLERQSLEARLALRGDDARVASERRATAEREAAGAREARSQSEGRLGQVRARREQAERSLAEQGRAREALSARVFSATTASDRVEMRLERVREVVARTEAEERRLGREIERLDAVDESERARAGEDAAVAERVGSDPAERIERLEADLAGLDAARGPSEDVELDRLRAERRDAEAGRAALDEGHRARRAALADAEAATAPAREGRRAAAAALEAATTKRARTAAELQAVVALARGATPAPGPDGALAAHLRVASGYELAVAAALGSLVRAGLAAGVADAGALLDSAAEGATVLVGSAWEEASRSTTADPPVTGSERLLDRVEAAPAAAPALTRLLAGAWIVDSLDSVAAGFQGIAVTLDGRALVAATGELRQVVAGAEDGLLERLSRRDELAAAADRAALRVAAREAELEAAARGLADAEEERDRAADALRAATREIEAAEESVRATERAVARREAAADESVAVRRAELTAELRAERRAAERAERERERVDRERRRAEREREDRVRRRDRMRARRARDEQLRATATKVIPALESALAAVAEHREALREALEADRAAGARAGEELRACAHAEAEVQADLSRAGERVTEAEVRAERARDAAAGAEREVAEVLERLGAGVGEPRAPLSEAERAELDERVERLARRRERLGPVNPLAKAEYEEAVARVEELESQRRDLETALAELRDVIDETDRRIRESFEETFEATARNFEEVVEELFPGGRGRLRLVKPDGPRPVIGDEQPEGTGAGDHGAAPDADDEASVGPDGREPGVEVEVTPAGKSTRRLSLMSGGERSLVALAFLFAVFLARPCPFYVLDEVEAALDDLNIDRFLRLVRRCADRAQFIVVTHQKRTMDAADCLYGVSMSGDGVSKVVSRRLPRSVESEAPPASRSVGDTAA